MGDEYTIGWSSAWVCSVMERLGIVFISLLCIPTFFCFFPCPNDHKFQASATLRDRTATELG